jgi:hypothetical protein
MQRNGFFQIHFSLASVRKQLKNGKMSEKLYDLSDQNYIFLRIFQVFGFLPLRLRSSDGILIKIPVALYVVVILIVGILKYTTVEFGDTSKFHLIYLYVIIWDVGFLMYSWIRVRFSTQSLKDVLKLLAEIDKIIIIFLKTEVNLNKQSCRTHKMLTFIFAVVCLLSLFHPILCFEKTEEFYDCLIRYVLIIFIQMRINQILYFYYKLYEKLSVINLNLDDIINYYHIDRSMFDDAKVIEMDVLGDRTITMIRERSLDKMKNKNIIEKFIHFRNIYEKCWLIQEKLESFFSFNVLLYFLNYVAELFFIQEKLLPDYETNRSEMILLGSFAVILSP